MNNYRTEDTNQIRTEDLRDFDEFSFLLNDEIWVLIKKQGHDFAVNIDSCSEISADEIQERAKEAGGYVNLKGNMLEHDEVNKEEDIIYGD